MVLDINPSEDGKSDTYEDDSFPVMVLVQPARYHAPHPVRSTISPRPFLFPRIVVRVLLDVLVQPLGKSASLRHFGNRLQLVKEARPNRVSGSLGQGRERLGSRRPQWS